MSDEYCNDCGFPLELSGLCCLCMIDGKYDDMIEEEREAFRREFLADMSKQDLLRYFGFGRSRDATESNPLDSDTRG